MERNCFHNKMKSAVPFKDNENTQKAQTYLCQYFFPLQLNIDGIGRKNSPHLTSERMDCWEKYQDRTKNRPCLSFAAGTRFTHPSCEKKVWLPILRQPVGSLDHLRVSRQLMTQNLRQRISGPNCWTPECSWMFLIVPFFPAKVHENLSSSCGSKPWYHLQSNFSQLISSAIILDLPCLKSIS